MERLYETTIVLDPQLKSTEIEDAIKKVTTFITNHGGEIVKVDEWGKRRLAYEINKKQYGYYVYIRFSAPGQLVRLLEREYRLMEPVLRYLTVRVDKLMLKMERLQEERAAKEAAAESAESAPAPASEPAEKPVESAAEAAEEAGEATEAAATAEAESKDAAEPQEQEAETSAAEAAEAQDESSTAESDEASPEAEEKS